MREAVTLLVQLLSARVICTALAATKYFFAFNIHEINHSQSLSPRTVHARTCAVDNSC